MCLKVAKAYIWKTMINPLRKEKHLKHTQSREKTEKALTSLRMSGEGSWGLRHAWATLITCSSFRGCSSTFAARKSAAGAMTWWRFTNTSCRPERQAHLQILGKMTYIPVEPCEGLDHVEPMHVDNGSVYSELGPNWMWLKDQINSPGPK